MTIVSNEQDARAAHLPLQAAGPGYGGPEGGDDGGDTGTLLAPRVKTRKPPLYRVLLLNDDYTPMQFVIDILMDFFHKNSTEATEIMLHVHLNGRGVCGVYPYEIAETKVKQVMDRARQAHHPLQCVMEKA